MGGVIGLWTLVGATLLVALRSRLPIYPDYWNIAHNLLAVVVVRASIAHALMTDGLMGNTSIILICAFILIVTIVAVFHLRVFKAIRKNSR